MITDGDGDELDSDWDSDSAFWAYGLGSRTLGNTLLRLIWRLGFNTHTYIPHGTEIRTQTGLKRQRIGLARI